MADNIAQVFARLLSKKFPSLMGNIIRLLDSYGKCFFFCLPVIVLFTLHLLTLQNALHKSSCVHIHICLHITRMHIHICKGG